MSKKLGRWTLVLLLLGAVSAFFYFDLGRFLSFEQLKNSKDALLTYTAQHPTQSFLLYFLIYVISTALSFPGAAVLTLAGGFLFGLGWGLLIVSFASTIGATLAFLASRFLLRDFVQNRFGDRLKSINEGVKKEGGFYLFTLRLLPIFPFFVVNLVMGLTPIRTWTYYWVSQVGMLPGTFVYVNAGTQLGQLENLSGILSPSLVLSFLALGLLPWIGKIIVEGVKRNRVYKSFKKPKRFDYNLIVIGAGSAGLVSSYIASTLKARVALIEKSKMGGDCLNTGCVPSKALIKSAKVMKEIRTAAKHGIEVAAPKLNFEKTMARVHAVIKKIEPHDSVERYTGLGVECLKGEAHLISPWEVRVNEKTYTARSLIIATGASPFVPPLEGMDQVRVLTSENLWSLKSLPARLVVLGGGPIGCEMAQAFQRLGSHVTLVERGERILPKEDPEVSDLMQKALTAEGLRILTGHEALRFHADSSNKRLICGAVEGEVEVEFDEVLVAVGRKANTKGFGLEEVGVRISKNGTLEHNEFMQTNFPHILTCGDVAGPYQFTHTASHQAYYACVNALFGDILSWLPSSLRNKVKVDESVIPWATFTDPEIATVGLTETAAREKNISYEVSTYGLEGLDRAIADGEDYGFIKVLTAPGKDKILGATIVGSHASDMVTEFISAMKAGKGLNTILGTIHIYPTHSEGNKYLAGAWKRERKPENALKKMEGFFRWQRS